MALVRYLLILALTLTAVGTVTPAPVMAESDITIGVLANNGKDNALAQWQPHAAYLASKLPGNQFRIVPLDFDALYPAVRKGLVDFVIVNTGQYVELEADAGIKRVATLNSHGPGGSYSVFGGVLFTRDDHAIETIGDLRGKSIAVPDTTSFGGWLMQLRELHAAGIEPSQLAAVTATGSHEAVVRAVMEGRADAGAIRTGILEQMIQQGKLAPKRIKIINEQLTPDFPFRHSTRLYPEWSFSKLRQTPEALSQKVAIALLSLPEQSAAARAAGISGWTIAADYTTAHELYRELKLGPYQGTGRFSLKDVLQRYRPFVFFTLFIIIMLALAALLTVRANRRLVRTLDELEKQRKTTEWALENLNEQTVQMEQTNEELHTINEQLVATNNERGLLLDALRSSEDQLRAILDSTAEAIYGTDLEGICTFCNTACLRMLGYDHQDQLIGQNMHRLIHHSHRDGSPFPEQDCLISQSFKQGEGIHVDDEVFWRSDGTCIPVEYWSYPQRRNGIIVGTVATFVDISERTKAQGKLMMLSRAVENSPAVVVITDRDGSIVYVNSKFIEITGFSEAEAIGQNPRILNAGVQSKEFYSELWSTILAGQEWRGEFCNRKKNGEVHWEFASISPIRDDHGRIISFVAVKEDITERRRVAEELQLAKEAAEAGNRSKSEFLANMSHEIRTPLNAIIGFNTLALETTLTEQQFDYLSRVNFAATSLLRIINEILDFSKIEAGKLELEQELFTPRGVLQNVSNLFQQQVSAKGLAFLLHCSENLPDRLVGDSVRLGQVLVNLVGNAVKFTEQGSVAIYASPTEFSCERVMIEFSVHDTGIGLEPDKLTNLFQPFTQADGSITRRFGGTGLGLSISKRIVELSGGQIWAESKPGHGSVFSFSMPFCLPATGAADDAVCPYTLALPDEPAALLPAAAKPGRGMAPPADREELAGIRILLVEDNDMNRALATELLQRRGALVESAVNGCEALTRILHEAHPYDLVLMDLQMPGMDGHEATRKIRTDGRFRDLPIIAVTAHAMPEEKQRCIEVGMNGYITKPLNLADLIALIRQHTGLSAGDALPVSTPAADAPDRLWEDIPGLDAEAALELIDHDRPLYLWLLRSFVEKHRHAATEIAAACARGDNAGARRRVHTVRGLAATIGATELRRLSEQLEETFCTGADVDTINRQVTAFAGALQELTGTLSTALNLPQEQTTPAPVFDRERIQQRLARLCNYLQQHDGHAGRYLQDVSQELEVLPPADLHRLQHLVARYDYDAALAQLQDLTQRLGLSADDPTDQADGAA